MAHKNIEQLARLIDFFGRIKFDIFVHLDKKWKEINPCDVYNHVKDKNGIYFTNKRISGTLFDFSLIEITLLLTDKAHEIDCKYGYFILLSGQDYPIKSCNYIANFLDKHYPVPFIDLFGYQLSENDLEGSGDWIYRTFFKKIRFGKAQNLLYTHIRNDLLRNIIKVPIYCIESIITMISGSPRDQLTKLQMDMYCGSAWWILPDYIIYGIRDCVEKKNKLVDIVKNITTPEEVFFQIMLVHIWQSQRNQSDLVYGPCMTGANFNNAGKNSESSGHPFTYSDDDFDYIAQLPLLFTRKFDLETNEKILDMIDTILLEKTDYGDADCGRRVAARLGKLC